MRLHKRCVQCERLFLADDMIFYTDHGYGMFVCKKCAEKENYMSNIKITAEVDGKQVPLENISTETFKAIKALEKPKEIPIIATGNFPGDPNDKRLFLKITSGIKKAVERGEIIIALDSRGCLTKSWKTIEYGLGWSDGVQYENIRPLQL